MDDKKKIPLISSEILGLWNSYMGNSMAVCVLRYFVNRVEDNETREILQYSLDLSNQHIIELTNFFNGAKLAIPEGFTDNDVNVNTPRLFIDEFYLLYLSNMARIEMVKYTQILSNCARIDIRGYFTKLINESSDLYNKVVDIKLSKGTYTRFPQVEVPKIVEYIKSQNFLQDWFGEKRHLLVSEITSLSSIILSNIIGKALTTGFGQVSTTKEVAEFMFKGKDISSKKIISITVLFANEDIPIPSTSSSEVTDSTISPFSEKLMMSQITSAGSVSIANKGLALAECLRVDINVTLIQMLTETMKYNKDGIDIMIAHEWFEQPPQAIKHEKLVGL